MRYTGKTLENLVYAVNMRVLSGKRENDAGFRVKVVKRDADIYPKHQWSVQFRTPDCCVTWESWQGTPREVAGYLIHELGKRGLYEKLRHTCWEHVQRVVEW